MSCHTCNIEKLFTSAYSGGRVGRFSRKVGQTPTYTLAPQQLSNTPPPPKKKIILQLYVIFHETRKLYSVTDKKGSEVGINLSEPEFYI